LEDAIATRIESNKARGLLAILAVEHDRAHSGAARAELLWPEQSEQAAAANLRRVISNLRRVIDDRGARIPTCASRGRRCSSTLPVTRSWM
jgi:DNA-binding SARP family transcriptional activator